jgi:hypothetical protein
MDPDAETNFIKKFSVYYFLKVHLHHFSYIKSQKEVIKLLESRFFLLFLYDDVDRRIRIQEAQKYTDSDPQHCL